MLVGPIPVVRAAMMTQSDAYRALSSMRALAVTVFCILLAWHLAERFVTPMGGAPIHLLQLGNRATFISDAIRDFLMTPFLIAVHRFILLDEVATRYRIVPWESRFVQFFGCTLVLTVFGLLMIVPVQLSIFTLSVRIMFAFSVVSVGLLAFVLSRVTILFPAIAIDAPGATWKNACDDTRGHAWRIGLVFALATLPVAAIIAVDPALWLPAESAGSSPILIVRSAIDVAVRIWTSALFVVIASRLLQALGERVFRRA
jgi:hypothetical protein